MAHPLEVDANILSHDELVADMISSFNTVTPKCAALYNNHNRRT